VGWRDELLGASFRGVPFFVRETGAQIERLYQVHKFAGSRKRPYAEDLGQGEVSFAIDAYLLGDDYLEQRRRLVEACTRPGAGGMLVLPAFTPRPAFCKGVQVRESSEEGGLSRLELQFTQVDEAAPFRSYPRPRQELEQRSAEASAAASAAAERELDLAGAPDGVVAGATASMRRTGLAIQALDQTSGPALEVADMLAAARALADDALTFATAPADAVAAVKVALESVLAAAAHPAAALESYRVLAQLQASELGGATIGARRDANDRAATALARELALAGAGLAAAATVFETGADARAARDRLLEALDAALEGASDDSYRALVLLRAALVAAMPPEGEDAPELVQLEVAGDTTTLHLAYAAFDDSGRDDEIRLRNRLHNPARVGAGVVLEVLSR